MKKWVPGFEGKYYATDLGEIFRKGKHKDRLLTGHKVGNLWIVKLTNFEGRSKDYNMGRLIYEVFEGDIPVGYVIKRRNNLVQDNRLINLAIESRAKAGKRTGYMSRARGVELLNESGEVINSWRSLRHAQKDLHMSHEAIRQICNGVTKKPAYPLRWEKRARWEKVGG